MRHPLYGIATFLLAIWLVFIVDAVIPAVLTDWGLRPRSLSGLLGIPAMPFLHISLGHVLGNTIPLVILLSLLAGSRENHWAIVAAIVVVSGVLLWSLGRDRTHVGASGLVFGLIGFLLVAGLIEKRVVSLAISIVVGLMYGGTLIWGLIPVWAGNTSWEGHLFGLSAGVVIAYLICSPAKWPRMNNAVFRSAK